MCIYFSIPQEKSILADLYSAWVCCVQIIVLVSCCTDGGNRTNNH